jgi:hypothetical protein
MKNHRIKQLAAVFLILTCSCTESPFLSKEEAEKLIDEVTMSRDPFHQVTNVVAIINNDIYYFDRLTEDPRRLTNTPDEDKTNVKLSWDKRQIAYINEATNDVVIIESTNGAHVKTLTDYDNVTQMEWAKDRQTLVVLIGNDLFSYGEALTLPTPETTYPFPWDAVVSFSMNAIGDYGYFTDRYNGTFPVLTYHSEMHSIDEDFNNFDGGIYDYVDFYDNKGGFLLGQTDPSYEGISRVVCMNDYNLWPAYEWDLETMTTPEFNADLEILLYGTVENNIYQIKAVYLGTEAYEAHGIYDILTKILAEHTSDSPIYLDWSH